MRTLCLLLASLSIVGCRSTTPPPPPAPATIPITSKSPQALERFEKGRNLLGNLRIAEASEELSEALKLDPEFATARALHGQSVQGPQGLQEMEQAAAQSATLPEAERTYIEALVATRQADLVKSEAAWRRLTTLAPGDWIAQNGLGLRLFVAQKDEEAAQAFNKAIELNPQAGAAINMLGYTQLRQGNVDAAIDAFKRYAAVNPQEPNAQDSLAEALMAGGKFAEAESTFRKATDLSSRFWNAWQGLAYAKYYAGDWAGGHDAVARSVAAAERTGDKVSAAEMLAFGNLAAGKSADAFKAFDVAEKVPGAQPTDVALVPVHRAVALVDTGRARDALQQISTVMQRVDGGQYPPAVTRNARRDALVARAMAEAALKDVGAVQKTADMLTQDAGARPDDAALQSAMHFARGLAAVAQNDLNQAKGHFDACSNLDWRCQWQALLTAMKVGDAAAADSIRARLTRAYVRDPSYLYVRSRLNQTARTTS